MVRQDGTRRCRRRRFTGRLGRADASVKTVVVYRFIIAPLLQSQQLVSTIQFELVSAG